MTGLVIWFVSIAAPAPSVIKVTEPSTPTFHPAVRLKPASADPRVKLTRVVGVELLLRIRRSEACDTKYLLLQPKERLLQLRLVGRLEVRDVVGCVAAIAPRLLRKKIDQVSGVHPE
jgi:hypothetical protein